MHNAVRLCTVILQSNTSIFVSYFTSEAQPSTKNKTSGAERLFPVFANQAEAGVGAMLPGSSVLGISHSSINVTFQ